MHAQARPKLRITEVPAIAEGLTLASIHIWGRQLHGGEFEIDFLGLLQMSGGRIVRAELFPAEARDAGLERVRELVSAATDGRFLGP